MNYVWILEFYVLRIQMSSGEYFYSNFCLLELFENIKMFQKNEKEEDKKKDERLENHAISHL